VGRMRRPPQAVDDPQFDARERRKSIAAERHDIGRIRHRPDAKAKGRAKPVILSERHDADALDRKRAVDLVRRQGWLVVSARLGYRLQGIAEPTADFRQGPAVGPKRNGLAHQPVDRAQIVDPVEMIGMRMSHQDRVEPIHPRVDQLLAQIG